MLRQIVHTFYLLSYTSIINSISIHNIKDKYTIINYN